MKRILSIIFLLLFIFSKTQQTKLQGNWILDNIKYQNGNPLEINHPLFSTFIEYDFNGNNLDINDQKFKVSIDNSAISTDYRKLNYKFENEYLVINENGDDKNYYFMKNKDFVRKYPEFEPQEIVFENKIVFEANSVIKPEFNYGENFEEFMRKNIPSYSSTSATNNFFKAKFILTKENKITDVQILQGISKKFDSEYRNAILKSEKYIQNSYGKDLLVTHTFNFFKMFTGLTNKEEKQIASYVDKGNSFYEKNEFQTAILNYEKLLSIAITPETKERFGYKLDQAFINLGVSFLANNDNSKACESFMEVGDKTNFKVRNYLINFCK